MKKLKKKWKSLEKGDKIYIIVIGLFLLSAIVAVFIGLSIYGWNIVDLMRDSRTIFLTFIATMGLIFACFFLGQYNMQHSILAKDSKPFKIIVVVMIIGIILSIALITVNWEVWTNGK